jgi:hypothetical protein
VNDSASDAKKLADLLAENGLTVETRLYRSSRPEYLSPAGSEGAHTLSANDDPSEAVIDVYEGGHLRLAKEVGAGLAFSERSDNEWVAPDRTLVELRLGDALDQGGRLYPVESVITDRVWYVTLPAGGIGVRSL